MAAKKLLVDFLILINLYFNSMVLGDKLQTKIYKTFKYYHPCVLLTNATHSIGCTSSMSGNVGVLHLIEKQNDLEWLLTKGPHDPYVPLLSSDMFNEVTMNRLVASKKINGALVIAAGKLGQTPLSGFSPDPTCPLDDFGMYTKDKDYSSCKKVEWNKQGNSMSMVYYDLPIFALSSEEEINDTMKCIQKHNMPQKGKSDPEYPLCAVELKDFMFAAKDTPTCRRKSDMPLTQNTFCDPLGDWNVWGTLYPFTKPLAKKEVIMVTSKMDSSGFFHDLAPGANNDVSGIVTLLGVAHALGDLKRQIAKGKVTGHQMKPVMFVLFNGEIWDYIGSSRMVWDMENGNFPYLKGKQTVTNDTVRAMDLSNIGHFIEISQVGQMDGSPVWIHSDPVSTKQNADTKKEVDKMTSYLEDAGKKASLPVKAASKDYPLPPASLQRFLKSKKGGREIPGIVLTDHQAQFKNKYYNSRFDTAENIGSKFELINKDVGTYLSTNKNKSEELVKLVKAVATTVYKLATDGKEPPVPLNVSAELMVNLISCFLISASCPAFREILPVNAKDTLPQKPYSRYISVAQLTNPITDIIYFLLGYYIGDWSVYDKANCTNKRSDLPTAMSRFGMKGQSNTSGVCVEFCVHRTAAVSPAFELRDYTSTEFSTWAESMWNPDFGVRIFLVAGPAMEYTVFGCGSVVLILSFVIVYISHKRAHILFTPNQVFESEDDASQEVIN